MNSGFQAIKNIPTATYKYSFLSILHKSFHALFLPYLEYCAAPAWISDANYHLKLLDRSLNSIKFISLTLNFDHQRQDISVPPGMAAAALLPYQL